MVNLDIPSNRINIGRGHSSNIILNDISVSRLHCFLNINKKAKKIFISDNNSKFGTLILVQTDKIFLTLELELFLQVGRTYLQILLKRPMTLFGCCGVSEKKNSDFYYLQNNDKHKFEYKLTVKTEGNDFHEEKILETKDEIKENGLKKTKINIMDDNDLDKLLITPTPETKANNLENSEKDEKELIDDDNGKDKGDDDSIVINDDENSKINKFEINGNSNIDNNGM